MNVNFIASFWLLYSVGQLLVKSNESYRSSNIHVTLCSNKVEGMSAKSSLF